MWIKYKDRNKEVLFHSHEVYLSKDGVGTRVDCSAGTFRTHLDVATVKDFVKNDYTLDVTSAQCQSKQVLKQV